MHSLCLPSYAKVNLGLFVKSKRPDGYHEIETILQQISLKDELRLTRRETPEIVLNCSTLGLPNGPDNLCVQAALALREASGCAFGAEIALKKTIPVGAGLGGGSSNAATVLLGLNRLWELDLAQDRLEAIAATLGSDVPFFISGGTALATGRGEKVVALKPFLQDEVFLIVFPNLHIPTHLAYASLKLDLTIKQKDLTLTSFKGRDIRKVDFFKLAKNDFEESTFLKYPRLNKVHQLLVESADYVSMSGSGSAIFALYGSREDATAAIGPELGQYNTFVTRSVGWGYSQLSR